MTIMDFLENYDYYPKELSLRAASEATGFAESTLRKAMKENLLTHYRLGNKHLILKASLRGYVLSRLNVGEQDQAFYEALVRGDV